MRSGTMQVDVFGIESRMTKVARLYLKRYTIAQICKELGVSDQTVYRDIARLKAEWKKDRSEDANEIIQRELADLEAMEQETAVRFEATGDISWMAMRLKVKERRAKLLGLDKQAVDPAVAAGPRGVILSVVYEDTKKLEEPEVTTIDVPANAG